VPKVERERPAMEADVMHKVDEFLARSIRRIRADVAHQARQSWLPRVAAHDAALGR
jgi:hypothetical protein